MFSSLFEKRRWHFVKDKRRNRSWFHGIFEQNGGFDEYRSSIADDASRSILSSNNFSNCAKLGSSSKCAMVPSERSFIYSMSSFRGLRKLDQSKYNFTVWKFHDFSIIQILREINSLGAKSAISTHLEALNYDFYEFLHFLKGEIYQIKHFQSP